MDFFPEAYAAHAEALTVLARHAPTAEACGHLHPEQFEVLHSQRWLQAFVPASYGGLQQPLPKVLPLLEAVAWADGSAGWVLTLCSGAGWFGGFLDPALARQVFGPKALLAGSGAASGAATFLPGGSFAVTGRWAHATGAPQATLLTANARLPDGTVRAFAFFPQEIQLHNNWSTIGLRATASHGFSVAITLPAERAFDLNPADARLSDPLYQYPFLPLAEATLAVTLGGMALRFLHELYGLLSRKKHFSGVDWLAVAGHSDLLASQADALHKARRALMQAVATSWPAGRATAGVSTAARQLAHTARWVTDVLYPYGGLAAANPETAMSRSWRDLHTATQHALLV